MYRYEYKNPIKYHKCEKNYVWNSSTCACKINRYLKCNADDLVITCDEVIDVVATPYDKPTNLNEKKEPVK